MLCVNCKKELNVQSFVCRYCGEIQSLELNNPGQVIKIGRHSSNTIVINDPKVSLFHSVIKINGNQFYIYDLESSNGTFVNRKRVTDAQIFANDIITVAGDIIVDWGHSIYHKKSESSFSSKTANKSVITIGRKNDNDIIIPNIKVSKYQAKIIQENQEWFIEDLNSSNGTYINGKRISKCKISLSDEVTIGGAGFSFRELLDASANKNISNVSLQLTQLTFKVKDKTIVDNINLILNSGEFVGLIGPSGAGKTTLMLMMTGMSKPSKGDVSLNHQSVFFNKELFKGEIGYVPQDDIIHRELTVYESLKYAADLRFNAMYSEEEKCDQVDKVCRELSLDETKDTVIGDSEKRGISGGQRKRVNLGHELLTEPNILFLDEPSSGLDPKTDFEVMTLLKKISDRNKIVVITTHSITKRNFDILTNVIILTKGGKLAYFGPANEAVYYFGVNEPEEIFEIMNKQKSEYWQKKYLDSNHFNKFIKDRFTPKKLTSTRTENPKESKSPNNGFLKFLTLTKRYSIIKLRDRISTSILLAQAPVIGAIISLVNSALFEKPSALFILVIASIFLGAQNSAREIVVEQSILKRERMIGISILSYVLSKVTVLSIICIIQSFLLSAVVKLMLTLNISFVELTALLFLTSVTAMTLGLLLSSMVKSSESALGLVPILVIPQFILSGFTKPFISMSSITKNISGLIISRWSLEAIFIKEFNNVQVSGQFDPLGKSLSGDYYVNNIIGFSLNNFNTDLLSQFIMCTVFLLITIGLIYKKVK